MVIACMAISVFVHFALMILILAVFTSVTASTLQVLVGE